MSLWDELKNAIIEMLKAALGSDSKRPMSSTKEKSFVKAKYRAWLIDNFDVRWTSERITFISNVFLNGVTARTHVDGESKFTTFCFEDKHSLRVANRKKAAKKYFFACQSPANYIKFESGIIEMFREITDANAMEGIVKFHNEVYINPLSWSNHPVEFRDYAREQFWESLKPHFEEIKDKKAVSRNTALADSTAMMKAIKKDQILAIDSDYKDARLVKIAGDVKELLDQNPTAYKYKARKMLVLAKEAETMKPGAPLENAIQALSEKVEEHRGAAKKKLLDMDVITYEVIRDQLKAI